MQYRTPLVRLSKMGEPGMATIHLKLESYNPTHSYKDRMALAVVEEAEQRGELQPGTTVVECTGGSTGPALALVCAVKNYPCTIISSDAYAQEKLDLIRGLGANLVLEPSRKGRVTPDLWPRMRQRAQQLVSEGGHYWTDQFHNSDALEGYRKMGAEILGQLPATITAFCGAVGTAGMLVGVGERLREAHPAIRLVALEPSASAVLSGGPPGSHNIDGTAAGFIPPLFRGELITEVMALDESEARATARRLAQVEGILAGTSTGLNVAAALRLARELGPEAQIVTVACDSGLKYLRGGLYRA